MELQNSTANTEHMFLTKGMKVTDCVELNGTIWKKCKSRCSRFPLSYSNLEI